MGVIKINVFNVFQIYVQYNFDANNYFELEVSL